MTKRDYQASKRRQVNKKKNKFNFLFNYKVLIILCLVFLFLVIFPLARNYNQKRIIDQEIADIKKEIAEFEAKNQDLKDLFSYLESESGYQEIARLNLGLKSPGEEVIIIEGLESKIMPEENKIENKNNWQKWIDYFFSS